MLLTSPHVDRRDFARRTGWELKPEGACKGDACVPLLGADPDAPTVEAALLSERLGMPLVHDDTHDLWALGPQGGGRALASAELPGIALSDLDGTAFPLASLRGTQVVMVAWASW